MDIPAGIYEEITGLSAAPPPVDEADYERRKYQRVPFGFRATIHVERKGGENTSSVVLVRDISMGGLSILNDEPMKAGTLFIIEFKGHEDRPVQVRCSVSRCATGGLEGTEYIVGATFEELLTEEIKIEAPATVTPEGETETEIAEFDPENPDFEVNLEEPATIEGDLLSDQTEPAKAETSTEAPAAIPAAPEGKAPEASAAEAKAPEAKAPAVKTPEVKTPEAKAPAPAKASSLFTSSQAAKPAPTAEFSPSEDEYAAPAKSAPKPPPDDVAPKFKVIPLPDDPPAAAAAPTPEAAPTHARSGGKTHEVLARVKEMLVKQEETIKAQEQELKQAREKASTELQSLRADVMELQKQLTDLRAKAAADDSAVAELANFLEQRTEGESPQSESEAA